MANAEPAKFFDKTMDEFSSNALIENMEADPEGYMALHKLTQQDYDNHLNTAYNERERQGSPDQTLGEGGGTDQQGEGTRGQGGTLSERFGDTSQGAQTTAKEIAIHGLDFRC